MIAVVFEVWLRGERKDDYLETAAMLRAELQEFDGFISVERFQSINDTDKLLSLSFWRDEAAVAAWRNNTRHREAQHSARDGIFANYRLRVASVTRDYGMSADRQQAPGDSQQAHNS
jgi:heme-degrading monooxygenase HmoA